MTSHQAREEIKRLEAEARQFNDLRQQHVANMDFEEAARCRDQEDKLRGQIFNLVMEHCI